MMTKLEVKRNKKYYFVSIRESFTLLLVILWSTTTVVTSLTPPSSNHSLNQLNSAVTTTETCTTTTTVIQKSKTMQKVSRFPVFGYGSNNVNQLCERVKADNIPSMQALLPHHERVFQGFSNRWKGAVASVQPKQNSVCRGTLAFLTESEIRKLDPYEGCDSDNISDEVSNSYKRVQVPVVVWQLPLSQSNNEMSHVIPNDEDIFAATQLPYSDKEQYSLEKLLDGTIYSVSSQADSNNRKQKSPMMMVLNSWIYIKNNSDLGGTKFGKPSEAYIAAIVKNVELHWKDKVEIELDDFLDKKFKK